MAGKCCGGNNFHTYIFDYFADRLFYTSRGMREERYSLSRIDEIHFDFVWEKESARSSLSFRRC